MKFCEKCGHELVDEAVVCTNCGCIAWSQRDIPSFEVERKIETKNLGINVCNFIFSVLAVLSLFFLFLSIILSNIPVYQDVIKGFVSSGSRSTATGYFLPNGGCAAFAILLSMGALLSGITSFILSIAKKAGNEKIFSSITRFIIAFFILLISIIAFSNSWIQ